MMNSMFALILFIAGAGIPIMAAMNSGLGMRLGSPIQAAFVLFFLALLITTLLLIKEPIPTKSALLATPPKFFMGGTFVVFYVLSITWIAPKFGLGNAIFIVLLGQLSIAPLVDHFALFGVPRAPISLVRVIGIGLIIVGIYLAKKPVISL